MNNPVFKRKIFAGRTVITNPSGLMFPFSLICLAYLPFANPLTVRQGTYEDLADCKLIVSGNSLRHSQVIERSGYFIGHTRKDGQSGYSLPNFLDSFR